MPGYANNCSVKQILGLHKTDGDLVQQGLYYEEAKPKEEYHPENLIEYFYNLFPDAVTADAVRSPSTIIHSSTPSSI
jgi:hypothetical protein